MHRPQTNGPQAKILQRQGEPDPMPWVVPNHMTFTCFAIADISTGYLTEADCRLLETDDLPYHMANTTAGDASFFYVPFRNTNDDILQTLRQAGFSDQMGAIMLELKRQAIPYVRFDCDGALLEDSTLQPPLGQEELS